MLCCGIFPQRHGRVPLSWAERGIYSCKAFLSLFGYQTEIAECISSHLSNAQSPFLMLLSQGKEQIWD